MKRDKEPKNDSNTVTKHIADNYRQQRLYLHYEYFGMHMNALLKRKNALRRSEILTAMRVLWIVLRQEKPIRS